MPNDVDHLRRQLDAAASFLHPHVARGDALLLRMRELSREPGRAHDWSEMEGVVLTLMLEQATALDHLAAAERLMQVLTQDEDAPEVMAVLAEEILRTCSSLVRHSRILELACAGIDDRLARFNEG